MCGWSPWRIGLAALAAAAWTAAAQDLERATPLPATRRARSPSESPWAHDPSTLVKCGGRYWIFTTGGGIASLCSDNLADWVRGPRVFDRLPEWTLQAVPGHGGQAWAPEIVPVEGGYRLYYSVSTWGRNTSAIGLATNSTLDPADPRHRWIDLGAVIQSRATDDFNAIDPSVLADRDGRWWMAFGSFWSGIKLIELDPRTGQRKATDSPVHALARHDTIEAACLCRNEGRYYLFVNWGLCARGTNSTYNIRVGRSDRVTGPYVDDRGTDLRRGGGRLFLGTEGRFIGPGHAGIFRESGREWVSFHFYDGDNRGRPTLAIRPLRWTADGWPAVGPEAPAPVHAAPSTRPRGAPSREGGRNETGL